MVFSSLTFLFLFLPLLYLLLFLARSPRWRNGVLIAASLLFYGWGEPVWILAMLFSTGHEANLDWKITLLALDVMYAHLRKPGCSPEESICCHPSREVLHVSQAFLELTGLSARRGGEQREG